MPTRRRTIAASLEPATSPGDRRVSLSENANKKASAQDTDEMLGPLSEAIARLRQAALTHPDYELVHTQFHRLTEPQRIEKLAKALPEALLLLQNSRRSRAVKPSGLTLFLTLGALEQLSAAAPFLQLSGTADAGAELLRAWVQLRAATALIWPENLPLTDAGRDASPGVIEATHSPALFLTLGRAALKNGVAQPSNEARNGRPYYFGYNSPNVADAVAFEFLGETVEHFGAFFPSTTTHVRRNAVQQFIDRGRGSPFFEAVLARGASLPGSPAPSRVLVLQLSAAAAETALQLACKSLGQAAKGLVLVGHYPA